MPRATPAPAPRLVAPSLIGRDDAMRTLDGRFVLVVRFERDGTVHFYDVGHDGRTFAARPYTSLSQPLDAMRRLPDRAFDAVYVGGICEVFDAAALHAMKLAGRGLRPFRRKPDGSLQCPHCSKSYRAAGPFGTHLAYTCGDRVGASAFRSLGQPAMPRAKRTLADLGVSPKLAA